jgi:hypothetical protein
MNTNTAKFSRLLSVGSLAPRLRGLLSRHSAQLEDFSVVSSRATRPHSRLWAGADILATIRA